MKNFKKRVKYAIFIVALLLTGCGIETDIMGDESLSITRESEVMDTSWQEYRFALERRYEEIAVSDNTIYGCYKENDQIILEYLNKEDNSIEKQFVLPEVSFVQNLEVDENENVYIWGNNGSNDFLGKIDEYGNFQKIEDLMLEDTDDVDYILTKGIYVDDKGYFYVWCEMGIPLTALFDDANESVFVAVDRIYIKDAEYNTLFYEQVANMQGSRLLDFQVNVSGKPVFVVQDTDGIYLQEVNVDKKKLEGEIRLNKLNSIESYNNIIAKENGFLFFQDSNLYQYSYDTQQIEKVLDLATYGIAPSNIIYLGMKENTVEIIDNYAEEQNSEYTVLRKGENNKLHLSLGTMQASQNLEKVVTQFNRLNNNIQVEIVTYYDEENGFEAGLEQLKLDIIRGEAPDVLEVSMIDYEILAEKGALVDLYEFMEQDSECKKGMLISNVIEAYELNGSLFNVSPSFQLYSMWGSNSVVNDQYGITLKELIQILRNSGKDINAIYGFSADEPVLTTLCTVGMDEFVDWERGTCNFEGENFKEVLEFAKEYRGGYTGASLLTGICEGDILMSVGLISSVTDYQLETELYGGSVRFIGYPTSEGTGTTVGFRGSQLAINAGTQNKEAAWEFVKYYLMNGYNNQGFPVVREQFDEEMNHAMEKDYVSTIEGTVEVAKGTYSDGSAYIEIFNATQSDVEAVEQLVERAENKFQYHTEIQNIINEEAEAYFVGQKELQEVTALIQNRVQLYLQEQMD